MVKPNDDIIKDEPPDRGKLSTKPNNIEGMRILNVNTESIDVQIRGENQLIGDLKLLNDKSVNDKYAETELTTISQSVGVEAITPTAVDSVMSDMSTNINEPRVATVAHKVIDKDTSENGKEQSDQRNASENIINKTIGHTLLEPISRSLGGEEFDQGVQKGSSQPKALAVNKLNPAQVDANRNIETPPLPEGEVSGRQSHLAHLVVT